MVASFYYFSKRKRLYVRGKQLTTIQVDEIKLYLKLYRNDIKKVACRRDRELF